MEYFDFCNCLYKIELDDPLPTPDLSCKKCKGVGYVRASEESILKYIREISPIV